MIDKVKRRIQKYGIGKESIRWLVKMLWPYKWKILLLVLLRCLITAVGVGTSVVNKYIVDYAASHLDVTASIFLAIAFSCISLAGGVALSIFSVRLTERFSFHLRIDLYEHILGSVWAERSNHHSEGLLARLTSDVNTIAEGIINTSAALAATLLQFVLAFALLWRYDHTLALLAVISGPFIACFSFFMGRRLKRIQVNLQQTEADYRVYLQEQLSHADIIKAFEFEQESKRGLYDLQKKRMELVVRKSRCNVLLRLGVNAVFSGSYLFAFISGALKIAAGSITYGTMTAFLSLVNQIQSPVLSISHVFSQAIGVLASASRVLDITVMTQEAEKKNAVSVRGPVSVSARDLHFAYREDMPILSGLSFDIQPGEIAAVMGPSGVGKTTLVRLLLGFLAPSKGEVLFTTNTGTILPCSEATRGLISYVPQGNTLFSGTIADNLKMGNPQATRAEMQEALKIACADAFVAGLPMGLDTVIGEKAHGISEGQAQRIAIARALLRKAPILILDEATSALDETTEQTILKQLREKCSERTCIVISHRKTVMDYADQTIPLSAN